MKKEIKKTLFFLLPIAIVVLFPLVIFFFSGEFHSLVKIQDLMLNGQPVLYGKAYIVNSDEDFKIPIIQKIFPDVMTLGNSRVLPFRQEFFKKDVVFFNGGSLVNNLNDLKKVMETLPADQKPAVVIVGLDFHLFHPENDLAYGPRTAPLAKNTLKSLLISGFRNSYRDLILGKYSVLEVFGLGDQNERDEDDESGKILKIGLKAIAHGDGFRNDGSYHYGNFISHPQSPDNEDHQFKDTLSRIERGTQLFYHGERVSDLPILALTDFLEYADKNNIHVIGFHPPYAPTIYDVLKSGRQDYSYMFKVNGRLKPIFSSFRASLFDFSDVRYLGASNKEFVDGFHGGEKTYLRIFIKMAEADPVLRKYVDLNYLVKILESAESDLEVI